MSIINKGILNSKTAFLRQVGNDWPTAQVVSTAEIIESSSNLYFTNARVVSALIPGTAITIEANGRISAESSTVVINDSVVLTAANNILTYGIGRVITDPKNILVIIEGMIQIPTTDYTVSGNTIVFTSPPPDNTNVEVRFFGLNSASIPTSITYTAGQNITIANNVISSTATSGSDFNPISFMLAGM